jgi:hypothetical protein
MYCDMVGASKVWIDGVAIPSQPVDDAIQASHQNATGPLHDCSGVNKNFRWLCLFLVKPLLLHRGGSA